MSTKTSRTDRAPLVFVPLRTDEAASLVTTGTLGGPVSAIAITPGLCETFGVEPDSEDAELAALQVAAVWSLLRGDRRLVMVARVDAHGDADPGEEPNGAVLLPGLPLSAVTAFFTGPHPADEADVARKLAHSDIDGAWQNTDVQALAADAPLLWHDVSELPASVKAKEH